MVREDDESLESLRAALQSARVRIRELETQVASLTRAAADDDNAPALLPRPAFNREVARLLAHDERYGGTSSLVYLTLEGLEVFAQRRGQAAAQAALRVTCDILLGNVRRSDIVGRLGPDEFGILLARCPSHEAWRKGEHLACVVHEMLAKTLPLNGEGAEGLPLAIRFGAHTFGEREDVATGLKRAAAALTGMGESASE